MRRAAVGRSGTRRSASLSRTMPLLRHHASRGSRVGNGCNSRGGGGPVLRHPLHVRRQRGGRPRLRGAGRIDDRARGAGGGAPVPAVRTPHRHVDRADATVSRATPAGPHRTPRWRRVGRPLGVPGRGRRGPRPLVLLPPAAARCRRPGRGAAVVGRRRVGHELPVRRDQGARGQRPAAGRVARQRRGPDRVPRRHPDRPDRSGRHRPPAPPVGRGGWAARPLRPRPRRGAAARRGARRAAPPHHPRRAGVGRAPPVRCDPVAAARGDGPPHLLHVRAVPPEHPRVHAGRRGRHLPRRRGQGAGRGSGHHARHRARHLRSRPVVARTAEAADRVAPARHE